MSEPGPLDFQGKSCHLEVAQVAVVELKVRIRGPNGDEWTGCFRKALVGFSDKQGVALGLN